MSNYRTIVISACFDHFFHNFWKTELFNECFFLQLIFCGLVKIFHDYLCLFTRLWSWAWIDFEIFHSLCKLIGISILGFTRIWLLSCIGARLLGSSSTWRPLQLLPSINLKVKMVSNLASIFSIINRHPIPLLKLKLFRKFSHNIHHMPKQHLIWFFHILQRCQTILFLGRHNKMDFCFRIPFIERKTRIIFIYDISLEFLLSYFLKCRELLLLFFSQTAFINHLGLLLLIWINLLLWWFLDRNLALILCSLGRSFRILALALAGTRSKLAKNHLLAIFFAFLHIIPLFPFSYCEKIWSFLIFREYDSLIPVHLKQFSCELFL